MPSTLPSSTSSPNSAEQQYHAGVVKMLAAILLILVPFAGAQDPKQGDIPLNVSLTGAESLSPEKKAAIVKEISRTVTDAAQIPDEMNERILDQLQQYGYFKAQVDPPQRKELWNHGILKEIGVRVNINEGHQYQLGRIDFNHATAFDETILRKAIPLQTGEIFNVENMRQGLKALRDLYCTRGYVEFSPVPDTALDEEHRQINLLFEMDEGPQYRFGKLILNGVEPHPGDGKKMLDWWKPLEGKVYNCHLADQVFQLAVKGNPKEALELLIESGRIETTTNRNARTVDFYYEFPDPK